MSKTRRTKIPIRKWLRALHRDIGYLAIGLTLVYALSGLAVNHIEDWDPNFTAVESTEPFAFDLEFDPEDEKSQRAAATRALNHLGRTDEVKDVYSLDSSTLEISLSDSTLYLDLEADTAREEGQKARTLLRAANWLHLNRGKKAWTYIADGYAAFLLFLAISGLFMLPLRKGLLGRGGLLTALGVAIPITYVVLSGGP